MRDPDKDDIVEKNPIPMKWVVIAIVVFAIGYHVALLIRAS